MAEFLALDRLDSALEQQQEQLQVFSESESESEEQVELPFSAQALAELAVDLSSKLTGGARRGRLRLGDSYGVELSVPGVSALSRRSAASRALQVQVDTSTSTVRATKRKSAGTGWFGMTSMCDSEEARAVAEVLGVRSALGGGFMRRDRGVGEVYQVGVVLSGAQEHYSRAKRGARNIVDQVLESQH